MSFATLAQISAQRGGLGGMGGPLRENYTLWEARKPMVLAKSRFSNGAARLRSITRVPTPITSLARVATVCRLETLHEFNAEPIRWRDARACLVLHFQKLVWITIDSCQSCSGPESRN